MLHTLLSLQEMSVSLSCLSFSLYGNILFRVSLALPCLSVFVCISVSLLFLSLLGDLLSVGRLALCLSLSPLLVPLARRKILISLVLVTQFTLLLLLPSSKSRCVNLGTTITCIIDPVHFLQALIRHFLSCTRSGSPNSKSRNITMAAVLKIDCDLSSQDRSVQGLSSPYLQH
jgi:hypothetical protein